MLKAKHSLKLDWILLLRNEARTLKEILSLKQTRYYCMAIIFAVFLVSALLIRQENVVLSIMCLSCASPISNSIEV